MPLHPDTGAPLHKERVIADLHLEFYLLLMECGLPGNFLLAQEVDLSCEEN